VSASADDARPLPMRAHNALCLLGFRGEGYSPAFVRETSAVHRRLAEHPEQPVRLLASPDRLCDACPNLGAGGCRLGGEAHEDHMRRQDEDVLARLSLSAGDVLPWREVLARVGASVRGTDLPAICTTCPWLHLGWCAEGVERVRAEQGA
jgi:uncharacterized protein